MCKRKFHRDQFGVKCCVNVLLQDDKFAMVTVRIVLPSTVHQHHLRGTRSKEVGWPQLETIRANYARSMLYQHLPVGPIKASPLMLLQQHGIRSRSFTLRYLVQKA